MSQTALAEDPAATNLPAPPNASAMPASAPNYISPTAQAAPAAPQWDPYSIPSNPTTQPAAVAAPSANAVVPNGAAPSAAIAPSPAPGAMNLPSSVPAGVVPTGGAIVPGPSGSWTAAPAANSAAVGAAQPPRTLPPSDDAKPLMPSADENAEAKARDARPIQSVMVKSRPKQAAAPAVSATPSAGTPTINDSAVAPARYDSPNTTPAPPTREPFPANLMRQSAPSGTNFTPNNQGVSSPVSVPNMTSSSPTDVIRSAPPPPPDPAKIAAAHAAADLFAGAVAELEAEASVQLLSLAEALANVPTEQRVAVVGKYWRLSRALKDHRWTMDELRRLEEIVPNRGSVEGPMLSTARAGAAARVNEAELAVVRAQESLAESSPELRSNGDSSKAEFVTSDRPLLGPYNTYFSTLFVNRTPPGRTREIDRGLPIRLETINDRTAAVQAALSAVHTTEEAHSKGETDMRTVLACHEALHQQRRDFLDTVLDYNLQIAEYAAAVAPAGVSSDKFVAMLIRPRQADRIGSLPNRSGGSAPSGATFDTTREFGIGAKAEGRPAADGWTPSNLRSVESESSQSMREPQGQANPSTESQRGDPFAKPSGSDRYGNYGDRYGNPNR